MASIFYYERRKKKSKTEECPPNLDDHKVEARILQNDSVEIELGDQAKKNTQEIADSNTPGVLSKDNAEWFLSILFDGREEWPKLKPGLSENYVLPVSAQEKPTWLPAIGTSFLSGAEYCPDALQIYLDTGYFNCENATFTKLRKHLSYLGWRIEFKQTDSKTPLFRYIAPDGKTIYNLLEACKHSVEFPTYFISNLVSEILQQRYVVPDKPNPISNASVSVPDATETESPQVNPISNADATEPRCHMFDCRTMEDPSLAALRKQGASDNATSPHVNICEGKDKSNGVDSFACAGTMDLNFPETELPPENPISDVESIEPPCCKLDHNSSKGYDLGRGAEDDGCKCCDGLPLSDISKEKLKSVAVDSSLCVQTTDLNIADTNSPLVNPVSDGEAIEPEYCPQAVINWYEMESGKSKVHLANQYGSKRSMSLKAKKHLVFVGWTLWYITKMKDRRELRYTSPKGKTYISLVTACKACIEQEILYGKMQDNANGDKKKNNLVSVHQRSSHNGGCFLDDRLEGSCPTKRSQKRVREIVEPSPLHFTPQTVLSCLIDNNVILPGAKVYYQGRQGSGRMVEGQICLEGVRCKCCKKVYSLTKFEAHADDGSHQPAAGLVLEDRRSLLECQRQLTQVFKRKRFPENSRERVKRNQLSKKNDAICSVCYYGGELVLCDQCPSAFHLSCLGLKDLPNGQWFCPSCRCGICNGSDFNGDMEQFTENTVLYCDQCEREYHVGCIRQSRLITVESFPKETWFCSEKCEQISVHLHKLMGRPMVVGKDNLTWTILKSSRDDYLDGYSSQSAIEHCCKLSVALGVMHECFEPIKEPYANSDLIEDVLFNKWSELNRMNFWGFYTILLEKDDEVISVATVRIHGEKVAEIPLVGTRFQYRHQGMCHILMDVLEKKLAEMGVERLVLPAVPQVLDAWTAKFGFSKMTTGDRLKFQDFTFLDFQDTTMCHKFLNKPCGLEEPVRRRRQGPPRRPRLHYLESLIPRGARRPRSSTASSRHLDKL